MAIKPPTKAVIAAAGFGTRFLPQTKAMPKEMLPLVDKPIIQYIVERLVAAGIKDIIIVTGYSKRSIEDHFDSPNSDLVNNLRAGGASKAALLKQVEELSGLANFVYVRQKGSVGNARPLYNVQHLISKDESFIYTYADELIEAEPNVFKQMIAMYQELLGAILPCIEVSSDRDFDRYGIVGGKPVRDGVIKMDTIAEKPGRAHAPSNMASVGGYLLTPDIFDYINEADKQPRPEGKEFQVQGVMQHMMDKGLPYYATTIPGGDYCDTGDKLDYLKTNIKFALQRDDIGPAFREYLRSLSL